MEHTCLLRMKCARAVKGSQGTDEGSMMMMTLLQVLIHIECFMNVESDFLLAGMLWYAI